ncbi:MAG: AAA family ATPase [Pseudobdellovibrio sp.]
MKKISIIGNPCSGKTTLSRALAEKYNLPLTHVDSIQFLEGMVLREPNETRQILLDISNQSEWIIDGLGPLKIIEDRFQKSDLVLVIRIPLWRNLIWLVKRQFKSIFVARAELPVHSQEASLLQTWKLLTNIRSVQTGLWPQLDRIFLRDIYINKVRYIKRVEELNRLSRIGLS